MLDIKVSSRGSGRNLSISQFTGNSKGVWGDCRFHINSPIEQADVWLVVEDVDDFDTECAVSTDAVVFLSAETSWPLGFFDESKAGRNFLNQFAAIYTCHDVYRGNSHSTLPFLPWMVNANHGPSITKNHERDLHVLGKMKSLTKTKEMSVICSAKASNPGHRLRLRLVKALKEHFGPRLDWFGNGVNPVSEKWTGLAPYRYSIAIENQVSANIITEKLYDPFLSWTFPIYGGAPNVHDFFPEGSLLAIDVKDLAGTINAIEELLEADPYFESLPLLQQARESVLGPLNVYSRYAEIARRHASRRTNTPTVVQPLHTFQRAEGARKSPLRIIGEQLNKVGERLVQRAL